MARTARTTTARRSTGWQARNVCYAAAIHICHTERELRAKVAAEVMLRDNDARFDFDLRLRLIENRNQLANRFHVLFYVRHDQGVAATFDFD